MKNIFSKSLFGTAAVLLFPTFALAACSEIPAGTTVDGMIGWTVSTTELNFESEGGTKEMEILVSGETDINFDEVSIKVTGSGADWTAVNRTGNKVSTTIDVNFLTHPRSTIMDLSYGGFTRQIQISQKASTGIVDKKINVTGATGTVADSSRPFAYSYDGNYVSHFISTMGVDVINWPFLLEYTLQTPNKLDYIVYYPRSDSDMLGSFNKFDIYVTTEAEPGKMLKIASLERGDGVHSPCRIELDEPIENVKKVYFNIFSAYGKRVSCAEMEFHQVTGTRFDYPAIFADEIYSALKPGVTADDIKKIPDEVYKSMAYKMLNGNYEMDFRVADFRTYQHPSVMASGNRTSTYSLRDNPTGIYVEAGDEFIVMVGDTKGQELSLIVQNLDLGWGSNRTLMLVKGENKLTAPMSGLLYVMSHTNQSIPLIPQTDEEKEAVAARTFKIHFINGKVQGYYKRGVTTFDGWKDMIARAEYREIDIVGDYAHLTWVAEDLRKQPDYIPQAIVNLDDLVFQQMDFCGYVKYDRMPGNRMYMHHINSGNPHAAAYRTAYTPGATEIICTESGFRNRLWVFGHEVGHMNQVSGFKWTGITEVSNNITALYNQQQCNGQAVRLTSGSYSNEKRWDLNENGTFEDDEKFDSIYESAIAAIVEGERPHCLAPKGDCIWLKLVPFWQLHLYVTTALGKDFYPNVFESFRTCDPLPSIASIAGSPSGSPGNPAYDTAYAAAEAKMGTTISPSGLCQLHFVEFACAAANMDLTEFFEKWGFLRPVRMLLDDYGLKPMVITQEDVDAAKARIAARNYPAPPHTVDQIIAIRDTNVDSYK